MGNCLGSCPSQGSIPMSSAISTMATTASTARLSPSSGQSTERGVSATSSSAGHSRFSEAASTSHEDEKNPQGQILQARNLRTYSFADLKIATRNFRSDTILGEGGFGKVFKGWVDERMLAPSRTSNGMAVAIKKLNPESLQGFHEWQSEVNFLGRLSHPNLVKLLGYCWENSELLLVYEFMHRGSLENHLFRRSLGIEPLSWEIRLHIALDAARGLAFLHSLEKQVIYRDFKAANILLDLDYNAKISDFGLAKLGPSAGESHVTTRVMGTAGYAAPEYLSTGHLYVKSDVYGFGVVLVEMLTGLRAVDSNRPKEKINLTDWVKPFLRDKKKLKNIMDARMEGKYPSKAAFQAAQLALNCLVADHKKRPSMQDVVQALEPIVAAKERTSSTQTTATQHHSQKPNPHPSSLHSRHHGLQWH